VPAIVANKPRRVAAIAVRLVRVEVMVHIVVDEMLWLLSLLLYVVVVVVVVISCKRSFKQQHIMSKKQTATPKSQNSNSRPSRETSPDRPDASM